MCPLVKEFQKCPEDFKTIVCVTGQHREMLDQVHQLRCSPSTYGLYSNITEKSLLMV